MKGTKKITNTGYSSVHVNRWVKVKGSLTQEIILITSYLIVNISMLLCYIYLSILQLLKNIIYIRNSMLENGNHILVTSHHI